MYSKHFHHNMCLYYNIKYTRGWNQVPQIRKRQTKIDLHIFSFSWNWKMFLDLHSVEASILDPLYFRINSFLTMNLKKFSAIETLQKRDLFVSFRISIKTNRKKIIIMVPRCLSFVRHNWSHFFHFRSQNLIYWKMLNTKRMIS